MKNVLKALPLLVAFLAPSWLFTQVTELALLPAATVTSYSNLPIGQLNRAHREQLTGQFEVALLTYNSALAWQPDWVPVLAARSELLYRLGRNLEAQRDRQLASRKNPNATAFFLAKGRNGLMPFLALYPREWYKLNYGLEASAGGEGVDWASPQVYFSDQYASITSAPDTALAVRILQEKVKQDVWASQRLLAELPPTYHKGVKKMLEANLAMLNHDYAEAVNLYTDALLKDGVTWPELYYNRGLGAILLYNYVNGCADLAQSSKKGFGPAVVMYGSLCNF